MIGPLPVSELVHSGIGCRVNTPKLHFAGTGAVQSGKSIVIQLPITSVMDAKKKSEPVKAATDPMG